MYIPGLSTEILDLDKGKWLVHKKGLTQANDFFQ
jgi:hypothetical protein